jgi:hypothetical protein
LSGKLAWHEIRKFLRSTAIFCAKPSGFPYENQLLGLAAAGQPGKLRPSAEERCDFFPKARLGNVQRRSQTLF